MHLIWHGTASVEAINNYGRILFDPFVPLAGSPVKVDIEEFDGFDSIFITHGHFDHIVNLPEIVKRNPAVSIYCTATPYSVLNRKGVPADNLKEIHYGDILNINGFKVHVLHGKHAILPKASLQRLAYILCSPARHNIWHIARENSICKENDETVFYQIESDGKTLCLMGSLNLRDEVSYPTECDMLILPYNGWDDNYPPALQIINRLSPKKILLDHYDDTFPPITMPLDLSPILSYSECPISAMELNKSEQI